MTTIYLAQMKWCEREEPICAGTNKKEVARKALRILKLVHGTGPVDRGMAGCSVPIAADDVEVIRVPFIQIKK